MYITGVLILTLKDCGVRAFGIQGGLEGLLFGLVWA